MPAVALPTCPGREAASGCVPARPGWTSFPLTTSLLCSEHDLGEDIYDCVPCEDEGDDIYEDIIKVEVQQPMVSCLQGRFGWQSDLDLSSKPLSRPQFRAIEGELLPCRGGSGSCTPSSPSLGPVCCGPFFPMKCSEGTGR